MRLMIAVLFGFVFWAVADSFSVSAVSYETNCFYGRMIVKQTRTQLIFKEYPFLSNRRDFYSLIISGKKGSNNSPNFFSKPLGPRYPLKGFARKKVFAT
jgi:hypothetical protein